MANYIAVDDTWLSQECRIVKKGTKFSAEFPSINGKPMQLSANIKCIDEDDKEPQKAPQKR